MNLFALLLIVLIQKLEGASFSIPISLNSHFLSRHLLSNLTPDTNTNAKVLEFSKEWAVFARPQKRKSTGKETDSFTLLMPLNLLFQSNIKNLLSFEAILSKMDIGIFLHQAKRYKWHKNDSEILRMSLNISHEVIDCAIFEFTEAFLSLSNTGGFIDCLGIIIVSTETVDSKFLNFRIYLSKPPFSILLDTIVKIFSKAYQVKYEYVSAAELYESKIVADVTKNHTDNLKSLWMHSAEKPENTLFLTQINGSTGLLGLWIFMNCLQSRGNQLVIRDSKSFSIRENLFQIRLDDVKEDQMIQICAFNLYDLEFSSEVMKLGLLVYELQIEKDSTKENFSIIISFGRDGTNTFADDKFSNVAFMDNFKWMQIKHFFIQEFLQRFSPAIDKNHTLTLQNGQESDIQDLNLLIFGENKEMVKGPFNLDAVLDWAYLHRCASIIIRLCEKTLNESNPIVDQNGDLLPPPNDTLLISIALSRPINLRKEFFKAIMHSMCKLLKNVEFSRISLLSHIQCIKIARVLDMALNTDFHDDLDATIPFGIEWICTIQRSKKLKDEESLLALIKELTEAFFLFSASIGIVNDFFQQEAEIKKIYQVDETFPKFLDSNLRKVAASIISFPRFSLITDFENTNRLPLPNIIQNEKKNISIVNENTIVKTIEKSKKEQNDDHWDYFIRVSQDTSDSYFYLTSLAALQHLVPAFKLSSLRKGNQNGSSQNLAKALLTLAKQDKIKGVIFSNIRSYSKAINEEGEDNLVEMSIKSLNSSTMRTNHKIISSVIDEASKFSDRGIVGLQLLFAKNGLTSCLLLLRKKHLRDIELMAKLQSWGKISSERKFNENRWKLFSSVLLSDIECWMHKIMLKGQNSPILIMNSSMLFSPVEYESWIKRHLENPYLPILNLYKEDSRIEKMMWIVQGGNLDETELISKSFPRIEISGQISLVIEKILNTCLSSMSDRNINLLGRSLDDIGLKISALVASKLQNGKFSVVDFFFKDGSNIEWADTMQLCDYIQRIWKGLNFVDRWILSDSKKKSESLKILLCYGNASNRNYMTIRNPFNLQSEAIFFKTFDAYFDPILEVDHEFKFVIEPKAIEQEEFMEGQPFEESNNASSIWVEWNGTRKTSNFYGQDFYEDELFLFRRIFILSIRKFCPKSNLKIRKYIRDIRIITTAPGQFSMKWEIDHSRAARKENIIHRLKKCMLDFVETCGAIPKNDPATFINLADYGGIAIESTNFINDIRNSELNLDKANKICINVLQKTPITIEDACIDLPINAAKNKPDKVIIEECLDSCQDNHTVSIQSTEDFQKIHQSMKESETDVKFVQSILASVMVDSLELLLIEFQKGNDYSVNPWTFFLCYDRNRCNTHSREFKSDQTKLIQFLHRNQPLRISRAGELQMWTEKIWLFTNDKDSRDKQISIVFSKSEVKNDRKKEELCCSFDLAEGLASWKRILLLILAESPSLGDHVSSVEMKKLETHADICVFYQKGQDFIGRELIERAWRNQHKF